jgi:hypothetical protein
MQPAMPLYEDVPDAGFDAASARVALNVTTAMPKEA